MFCRLFINQHRIPLQTWRTLSRALTSQSVEEYSVLASCQFQYFLWLVISESFNFFRLLKLKCLDSNEAEANQINSYAHVLFLTSQLLLHLRRFHRVEWINIHVFCLLGNGGLLKLALVMRAEAPVWVLGEVWECTVIKAPECTDEAQSFHRMTCSEQQILMENLSLIVGVKWGGWVHHQRPLMGSNWTLSGQPSKKKKFNFMKLANFSAGQVMINDSTIRRVFG